MTSPPTPGPGWYPHPEGGDGYWDGTRWAEGPPQTPAGWYPDPANRSRMRYWDGSAWIGRAATAQSSVVTWGWITAFLFPLVGFILGIIAAARGEGGHGAGIIAVSVLVVVVVLSL